MNDAIRLHPKDNVCTLLRDARYGQAIYWRPGHSLKITSERIPAYHKVACIDFKPGDVIVKYGVTIGKAIKPIARGEWVWEENIISAGSKTEG